MFIVTFANCYPKEHSRYAYKLDHTIILFQPVEAFAAHHIPKSKQNDGMRDKVRESFYRYTKTHYSFFKVMQKPVDAYRYVKPLEENHSGVQWWQSTNEMLEFEDDSDNNNNNFIENAEPATTQMPTQSPNCLIL